MRAVADGMSRHSALKRSLPSSRWKRSTGFQTPPITDSVASTAQPVRPALCRRALRLSLSSMIVHVRFVRTDARDIALPTGIRKGPAQGELGVDLRADLLRVA